MDFYAILDQVIALLRQRQRVTYRALKRQWQLDDSVLEDLAVELIKGQRLAADEDGEVLVSIGDAASVPAPAVAPAPVPTPLTYTPALHLTAISLRCIAAGERQRSRAKKAWRLLQGESPCRVRARHPPVASLASMAESWRHGEQDGRSVDSESCRPQG